MVDDARDQDTGHRNLERRPTVKESRQAESRAVSIKIDVHGNYSRSR